MGGLSLEACVLRVALCGGWDRARVLHHVPAAAHCPCHAPAVWSPKRLTPSLEGPQLVGAQQQQHWVTLPLTPLACLQHSMLILLVRICKLSPDGALQQ
jgi:hypothetical protein